MHRAVVRSSLVFALLPGWSGAQVASPSLTWNHEFTAATGACELNDGSLVVTDAREPAIIRLSPNGGATQIGRRGTGPGEYQGPDACFVLPGDTVLVFDRAARRFVVLPPGGAAARTVTLPQSLGRAWFEPRGFDDQGRIVLEGSPADGRSTVLGWRPGSSTVDTLTVISTGSAKQLGAGSAGMRRDTPFAPRAAVVAASGVGMAIVTAEPFAVSVHRNGTSRTGLAIPFRPVPVDDGDIEAYITANSPPPGTTAMGSDGRPRTIGAQRMTLANFGLSRSDFPAVKAPFDPNGVLAGRDGSIWVRLHRQSSEQGERYEVWNSAAGSRGTPVTLAAGQRLLAVGRSAIYLIVTDDNDVQRVMRSPR